jgi:hypothetical protein
MGCDSQMVIEFPEIPGDFLVRCRFLTMYQL